MTPEQREELKRAADKIIDDGWYEERDKGMAIDACASDYDFIFKANPSAILSLIAQVEALTVPVAYRHHLPAGEVFGDGKSTQLIDSFDEAWEEQTVHGGVIEALYGASTVPTIPAIPGTKEGA